MDYVLAVWDKCAQLPPVPRAHARRKLERLVLTGRMLPTARVPLKVEGTREVHLLAARQALNGLRGWLSAKLSPLSAKFLLAKTRLSLTSPRTLADRISGHKRAAEELDLSGARARPPRPGPFGSR